MKNSLGYLIAFLLGWSCAVWSYSDSIYKNAETSMEKPILQEDGSKKKK